jgi:hypothetical protein
MTNATIIPFPSPARADADRLKVALQGLQEALDEQQRALSDWRFAMTELGIGVAGLSHALTGYKDALGSVGDKIENLHEDALQLEAWADRTLAAESTP